MYARAAGGWGQSQASFLLAGSRLEGPIRRPKETEAGSAASCPWRGVDGRSGVPRGAHGVGPETGPGTTTFPLSPRASSMPKGFERSGDTDRPVAPAPRAPIGQLRPEQASPRRGFETAGQFSSAARCRERDLP